MVRATNLARRRRHAVSRRLTRAFLPFAAGCGLGFVQIDLAAAQSNEPTIVEAKYVSGSPDVAPRIVNGLPTNWYPTVGALLKRDANAKYGSWCTGTLIGCNTYLTAGHCIAEDETPSHYKVFFQHAGFFDVTSIDWQKSKYVEPTAARGAKADVAVLKLARPVTGITPHKINEAAEHSINRKGTIVGFGRTGGQNYDYGLKRYGFAVAAACRSSYPPGELLCWNYDGQQTANTCNGDSGGPIFLQEGRPEEVVTGITSGGVNPACLATDHSFDTSVFYNRAWIAGIAGADLGHAACGSEPVLQDKNTRYYGFSGHIDGAHATHEFRVKVKDVRQLRVGANLGVPIGLAPGQMLLQPQLYVIAGQSNDVGQAVCSDKPDAQAAFCAVQPTSEDYTIVLTRGTSTNIADFQLVISVF